MSKNVKLEFENRNLESKIVALQREKDSLLSERQSLREMIDDLKCERSSDDGMYVYKICQKIIKFTDPITSKRSNLE